MRALQPLITLELDFIVAEITSASKEQAMGISQINLGLTQVDQVAQQVTTGAEETASASEELSGQSLQLKQILDRFRLRRQQFDVMPSGRPEVITPEILHHSRLLRQGPACNPYHPAADPQRKRGGKPSNFS